MAKYYDGKETEFNGAMLQSFRIDKELQLTNQIFSTYGLRYDPHDLRVLKAHVDNIFDEVMPKMNKEESRKAQLYIKAINDVKNISDSKKNSDGEYVPTVDQRKYELKVHRIRAFRRFVIQVADRSGMMNPNKKSQMGGAKGF